MDRTIAYRVRRGFTFTDMAGARPRTYAAGETVLLTAAVGDRAHQLQRVPAETPTRPRRSRDLAEASA
jgi:hypothetical protein